MSQGPFSDLLIRFEAFKRIIVFCQKIDFSNCFGSKMTKFSSQYFSLLFVPRDHGVSLISLRNW